MVSTNISIKKEAYDFLKSQKGENQSFSDVVLGFKKRKKSILDFYGVLKDVDWKQKEEEMKKFRASFENRSG